MSRGGIVEWRQRELMAEIEHRLASRMEIVGKFIETEARQRLVAIAEPKYGEKYRRFVVGKLLTYLVEQKGKEIIVWVGVRRRSTKTEISGGEEQSGSDKESDVGLWIELGTAGHVTKKGRKIPAYPAHPYLRPAVFNNAREIVLLLEGR